jgi:hypothetical protein
MLKLEDFKISEVEFLKEINGGREILGVSKMPNGSTFTDLKSEGVIYCDIADNLVDLFV